VRGILEPDHLIVILLIILVLCAGEKIPELAGGSGQGVRAFRRGRSDLAAPAPAAEPLPTATAERPVPDAGEGRAPKRRIR
jgi:TatA/E family protein of Tat protein translocase